MLRMASSSWATCVSSITVRRSLKFTCFECRVPSISSRRYSLKSPGLLNPPSERSKRKGGRSSASTTTTSHSRTVSREGQIGRGALPVRKNDICELTTTRCHVGSWLIVWFFQCGTRLGGIAATSRNNHAPQHLYHHALPQNNQASSCHNPDAARR